MIQLAKASWLMRLWLVLEGLVDFLHRAADRRDEVGSSLDALDGAKLLTGGDFIAHLGGVDIDNVAQLLLSVIGDTNVAGGAVYFYKLVGLGIIEPGNDF